MTFSRDESNQPGTKEQNEALKKRSKNTVVASMSLVF